MTAAMTEAMRATPPSAAATAAPVTAGDLWTPVRCDRTLLRKYDRPGPRYTSYPTAPQFRAGFDAAAYRRLLEQSRDGGRPLSLYVHLPFCRSLCFYCGCNVTIARSAERGTAYLPLLAAEMERAAALLGAGGREVVQIHWGGGTPNFLLPADLARLMATIRERFRLAAACEIGVEVDPRTTSDAHLDALAALGCNRLSVGVQDLDPEVQRAVNRVQPAEMTWRLIDGARRRGIGSINVDLVYGLPHQTPERFAATLREVIAMQPDRLAVFSFAYLPQMLRHQRVLDPAALPSPEIKLALLEQVVDALTGAGYVFIGMDHFARPTDPLALALRERTLTRNFQGYSTWAETDLVGFGASAISQLADGFAQNLKGVEEYGRALAAQGFAVFRGLETTGEDRLRRDVILRLMCQFRVEKAEVERRWGIDFDQRFAAELAALAPLAADGLVELGAERLEVTPVGRLLVRNVAMAFDAYLGDAAAGTGFSRTV